MTLQKTKLKKSITLESGKTLQQLEIAYHSYGKLNADGSNVIWVCHALTANSDVLDWWKGLFGPDTIYDPKEYFIICANVLGSHYGTTSPLDIDPECQKPYYRSFPLFTIRDIVKVHQQLASHLNIEKIHTLIGGSLGGQQALEWAISSPDTISNLILLATNAAHSPWGIAFNESQRLAIQSDPTWKQETAISGINGMKTARSIALLSYRNHTTYCNTQKEYETSLFPDRAASYQRYQGEKLAKRFNAYSYWYLSKAMDSHHVARGRDSIEKALSRIQANTLVISITDDVLFPEIEQKQLHNYIKNSSYSVIESQYGHDGFLIETDKISDVISTFYKQSSSNILKLVV